MWMHGFLITASLLGQAGARTPRPARPRSEGTPRAAAPATPVDAENRPTLSPDEETGSMDATLEDPSRPLVDVKRPKPRVSARELVAETLAPPKSGGLTGRSVSLATALSHAPRGQHLEAARSYWRLVTAVAAHHDALDEYKRLSTLVQPDGPPALSDRRPGRRLDEQPVAERLQIEQTTARARVRESELLAIQAQAEIAALLGEGGDDPLPLPADLPHVGPYRTHFPQALGSRQITPHLRWIARALPVQLEVIDLRAQAILSAEDSARSAIESYNKGDSKLAVVTTRLAELSRQRRLLMNAVQGYNESIAEYAVAAAGETASGADLAAMMIKASSGGMGTRSSNGQPSSQPPSEADPAGGSPIDIDEAPAERSTRSFPRRQFVARAPGSADRTTRDPWDEAAVVEAAGNDIEHLAAPLYGALVSFDPVKRAHKVAESLHFDDHLPPDSGTAIGLVELLSPVQEKSRKALVAAYWRAREHVARHHVLTEQLQQLQGYTPMLLEKHNADFGAREMLDLHTAKLAAEAAVLEARLALREAQVELTALAGRATDGPWLLPQTPPHSGRYKAVDAAGPGAGAIGRQKRLSSAAVANRHESLVDRATAVVLADAARSQSVTDFKVNQQSIDDLLLSVESQTQESLDFLAALTKYNDAIAEYVALILPAGASAQQFASSLVIFPKRRDP